MARLPARTRQNARYPLPLLDGAEPRDDWRDADSAERGGYFCVLLAERFPGG